MSKISLIVAMDSANGIGRNNQLLCHLPADLQHFKTMTLGKPIVMGRLTFLSIGRPLPGRQNVVLSHHLPETPGITRFSNLESALAALEGAPEIMIIGGATLFEQTLPLADRLYVTHIHHRFEADTFFPKIEAGIWQCSSRVERAADEKNPYAMSFCQYEKF